MDGWNYIKEEEMGRKKKEWVEVKVLESVNTEGMYIIRSRREKERIEQDT